MPARLGLAIALTLSYVAGDPEPGRAAGPLIDGHVDSKLSESSRQRLIRAEVHGEQSFKVVIASSPGKNGEVAMAIVADGGNVTGRADDVGYLEASLPIEKVAGFAVRTDITAMSADDIAYLLQPRPRSAGSARKRRDDGPTAPLAHPYLAGADIGTLSLRRAHPTFDGRGTTVAIIDGIPDFLLPELQDAKDISGKRLAKFRDISTTIPPKTAGRYSPWFSAVPVVATDHQIVVDGMPYVVPNDGPFLFANISAAQFSARFGKLYGATPELPAGGVGVLWDERDNSVRFDMSGSHKFAEAEVVRDFAVGQSYVQIPLRVSDRRARPSLGCALQTAPLVKRFALLCGTAFHASGSSGSVAASLGRSGRIEGIAPGAQIESIFSGGLLSGMIDASIKAARDPHVAVIVYELVSGVNYAAKDGRYVQTIIQERLSLRYGKVFVQGTDDYGGVTSLADQCVPAVVLCVNSYESAKSYRTNVGVIVTASDNLHFADAFGPAGNGRLKPDVLAPAGWLSLGLGFTAERTVKKGVYSLAPGYTIFGGVSQAAPTAAGAAAVLMSAARQAHIPIDPGRIIAALSLSARYIPHLPAYTQGNGLLQIDKAFALLQKMRSRTDAEIAFDAPVRTVTSWSLPVPNRGYGYLEREGLTVGKSVERTVTVTQRRGAPLREAVRATIVGNDGTFAISQGRLRLALHRPVAIRVRVTPRSSGVHSALLRLVSAKGDIVGETMLTGVVGEQFDVGTSAGVRKKLIVPVLGKSSWFLTVPRGAQALVVGVRSSRKTDFWFRFTPYGPDGVLPELDSGPTMTDGPILQGEHRYVFPHPRPGTWEFAFYDFSDDFAFRGSHPDATPLQLDAQIIDARVKHGAGAAATREASVMSLSAPLRLNKEQGYTISVPANAFGIGATLKARQGDVAGLYLFDCTMIVLSRCVLVARSIQHGPFQYVFFPRPNRGRWRLMIDPRQGSAEMHIKADVFVVDDTGRMPRLPPVANGSGPRAGVRKAEIVVRTVLGNESDRIYLDNGMDIDSASDAFRRLEAAHGLRPITFDVHAIDQAQSKLTARHTTSL